MSDGCAEEIGRLPPPQCYDQIRVRDVMQRHDHPSKIRERRRQTLEVAQIKGVTGVDVCMPEEEKITPRSIRDLGFAGMWAYRDDITDGLSYVNNLRESPRG